MLLSKKETPKEFMGMYYAGILNLLVGMLNTGIYSMNGYTFTLVCACMSVGVGITIFLIIRRKVHAMTWDKLTKKESNTSGLELG